MRLVKQICFVRRQFSGIFIKKKKLFGELCVSVSSKESVAMPGGLQNGVGSSEVGRF